MNTRISVLQTALAAAMLFPIVSTPVSAADVCRTIGDATAKIWQVPVHLYSSETAAFHGKQAKTSESIYTSSGEIFVMVSGRWTRSRMTIAELKAARNEGKETPKQTCSYVRDEAVNGEAASVYSRHAEEEDFKTDMTVWISKSRNLPLRSESDMDVGGAMGKSHRSTRYEYSNVQPPPGVK